MLVVIQRVKSARVYCNGVLAGNIASGAVVFVGFEKGDSKGLLEKAVSRIVNACIFEDARKRLCRNFIQAQAEILLIPNFTLSAYYKGKKFSFDKAMPAPEASNLFVELSKKFACCLRCEKGCFGSHMDIDMQADGPVNIVLKF